MPLLPTYRAFLKVWRTPDGTCVLRFHATDIVKAGGGCTREGEAGGGIYCVPGGGWTPLGQGQVMGVAAGEPVLHVLSRTAVCVLHGIGVICFCLLVPLGYFQVKPSGDIVLNTNGYLTHTTQLSMNDALEIINCKVQGGGCVLAKQGIT
jgi:hypothetical protein